MMIMITIQQNNTNNSSYNSIDNYNNDEIMIKTMVINMRKLKA